MCVCVCKGESTCTSMYACVFVRRIVTERMCGCVDNYQCDVALCSELAELRGPGRDLEQRGREFDGRSVVAAAVVRLHELQLLYVLVYPMVLGYRFLVVWIIVRL